MEESAVSKNLGAAPCVLTIDSAVVSSVRRALFCDKSNLKSFATDHLDNPPHLLQKKISPYGSVGYNLNVSRDSAHSSKSSGRHLTPKRSM